MKSLTITGLLFAWCVYGTARGAAAQTAAACDRECLRGNVTSATAAGSRRWGRVQAIVPRQDMLDRLHVRDCTWLRRQLLHTSGA